MDRGYDLRVARVALRLRLATAGEIRALTEEARAFVPVLSLALNMHRHGRISEAQLVALEELRRPEEEEPAREESRFASLRGVVEALLAEDPELPYPATAGALELALADALAAERGSSLRRSRTSRLRQTIPAIIQALKARDGGGLPGRALLLEATGGCLPPGEDPGAVEEGLDRWAAWFRDRAEDILTEEAGAIEGPDEAVAVEVAAIEEAVLGEGAAVDEPEPGVAAAAGGIVAVADDRPAELPWDLLFKERILARPDQDSERGWFFGRICVEQRWVTQTQVNACLREQLRLGEEGRHVVLGQIMVEKGYLAPANVEVVLAIQRRRQRRRAERLARGGGETP